MDFRNAMMERLAIGADLPGEVGPGQSLVEIVGDRRVLIERHCGVVAYGCTEICVKVPHGILSVKGTGLMLARMTKDQLVITGSIEGIGIQRGRK